MQHLMLIKPPRSGRRHHGIPKYHDNPAMKQWYFPDTELVQTQYTDLVQTLHSIDGIQIHEYDFPLLVSDDHNKNFIDQTSGELLDHDFVFIRDPFVSNQRDTIIISNFTIQDRIYEAHIAEDLITQTVETSHLQRSIIHAPTHCKIEWWDFRYLARDRILFAGLQRNNPDGVRFVQETFDVSIDDVLTITGNGFHLDTFFTVVTDEDGWLKWGIICSQTVAGDELRKVQDRFDHRNIPLFVVDVHYGIGTNGTGVFASNALPYRNHLIGSALFDEETESRIADLGIQRYITPLDEYNKSGGSVHCVTNQL